MKCSDVVSVGVYGSKNGGTELAVALKMNDNTFAVCEIIGTFTPHDQSEWEKEVEQPAMEAAAALRARLGLPPK